MTTRRFAFLTLWATAIFCLALAFSMQAQAEDQAVTNTDTFEVAIEVQAPQAPSVAADLGAPLLVEIPTPAPPPAWVEIPVDLISTPTPEPDEAPGATVPLPMLTTISSAPRGSGAVYLTFDDGPHPTYTNQVLDLLARYNAKATFFVLGSAVDNYPEIAQRIVNEGHAIANHTYHHEALPRVSAEHAIQTLEATNNAIARATGRVPGCMRPPYGSLDQPTYDLVTAQGYSVSMWEVDSNDWKLNDSYAIAAGVLRDTDLGERVLFHDGPANRASTVAAVESVLSVLSNRGVQFHALPC